MQLAAESIVTSYLAPDLWDVREGKPTGRTVGRIYQDISAGRQWFWCLNDRYPSPPAHRGYAPTRANAMLALKHQWRERGPQAG